MARSISSHFTKDSIVAEPGFNRWQVSIASIATHLCIGSVYAWSVFNPCLTRELGVVAGAADDWTLSSVVGIFSVAIVFLGLAAAFTGKWLEDVGPRMVGIVAALCWGGGFVIGSIGISMHQLSLVYLGYGVIGGCGLGLGYASPISTLRQWFPDQRNVATGMAIIGFGGGAIVAVPLKSWLLSLYASSPDYLGAENALTLIVQEGRQFIERSGQMVEVVVASTAQMAQFPGGGEAGVYAVGTGNTGSAGAFLTLGIIYFLIMIWAAFSYKVPVKNWKPEGWAPIPEDVSRGIITRHKADVDEILNTRQFWQLWLMLCLNTVAGISIISVAVTMISEIYSTVMPHIVTTTFALIYVLMISIFNVVGRFFWRSTSDFIGDKNTHYCFFVLGSLLFASIPFLNLASSSNPSILYLAGFYTVTIIILTIYGGGYATVYSYLAYMFGITHVTSLHRIILTAMAAGGILGPFIITWLRNISVNEAINDLVAQIEPSRFGKEFGAPLAELEQLLKAKTVTIARLMEIVPPGTIDPTSSLYNTSMFAMASLLVIAFCANLFIRPVAKRNYFVPEP